MEYRYRKAQFALEKGDEDLAREALKRRKSNAVSYHHPLKSMLGANFNLLCPFQWDREHSAKTYASRYQQQ